MAKKQACDTPRLTPLENMVARYTRDIERAKKQELKVNLWLPGCKEKDTEKRHAMHEKFVAACFWNHCPLQWAECDAVEVREQDADIVRQLANDVDPRYHEYMNK